jgi:crotonobetainyl-CoA:carnitine CoA-transferase CaiB-like acyl-CoA transferase
MGFARAQAGPGVPQGPDLTLAEIRPASLRLGAAAQAPGNADGCSALGVATALLLGLFARARTGEGQEMRTSMLSTSAYAVSAECDAAAGETSHLTPDPLLLGLSALYRLYQADDGWVFLACPRPHEWAPLCRALAADAPLADDARFATPAARRANDAALATTLEDVFRRRGAAAWEARCLAEDVACAAVAPGPVAAQAMSHPLMRENGFLVDAEHPLYGTYRRLAPLVHLAAAPAAAGPPCTLGQHTERVLGELGYDAAAIADLVRRQVVRTAT